jgi:hypothetical protein
VSKRFGQDSISAVFGSSEPVAPIAIEGHPNEQKGWRLLDRDMLPDLPEFMTSFQEHNIEAISIQFLQPRFFVRQRMHIVEPGSFQILFHQQTKQIVTVDHDYIKIPCGIIE